jgi:VWFA-related protein
MNRRLPVVLLIAFLFALSPPSLVSGQAQGPQGPPQPVFKSGVELVRLDVRVVDGEGRPIKDLKASEVEISEGGEPRPIVLFQHIEEPTGPYLEVARRTIGGEVSTNRGAPRGHLYVLVFDQAHITVGNEQKARLAAERFLKTHLRVGDRVALFAVPGPGPQLSFSSNADLAVSELVKIRGSLDREAVGSLGGMSAFEAVQITRGTLTVLERVATRAAAATDVNQRTGGSQLPVVSPEPLTLIEQLVQGNAKAVVDRADSDTRAMLAMLGDVVRSLAGVEGRKTVLLFSEGFFSDNVTRDLERVAAAAAQAYAVVYSFDLNARVAPVNAAEPSGGEAQAEVQSRIEPLGGLAAETDGQLVIDANAHLDSALNQIAAQSQDYYIIGFEPPAAALADRNAYHRVRINLKRGGAKVNARTGYSLRDPVLSSDRRRAIDTALGSPFPQQGLPLELTTYVLRGSSGVFHRVFLSLEAELPVAAGGRPGAADVVFVAKSARDGRVVASGTDSIPLPREGTGGRTTATGLFHVQFDAPPGEFLMRVVVREPGGATGSVDRRFEVRNFDGMDVTASDLIVGRRTVALPVRATVYADDVLTGLLEVYARSPRDLEQVEVWLDLAPLGGETALASIKADLLDVRQAGASASRPARIELPLKGIAPGSYVARATVRAQGETVTELEREVVVLPGTAPPEATPVARALPKPVEILGGDLTRRLVSSVRSQANDPAVVAAADFAAKGTWDKVGPAVDGARQPREAGFHVLKGLALFAAEQYAEAAVELDAASVDNPMSALVAFHLGWVHAASSNDQKAIGPWRNATVLDPTMVSAYLALADAYLRLGQPPLAAQVLHSGLAVLPRSPELATKLAEVERR